MAVARVVVHVQPGARRPGVVGRHGDAWKIRVSAPPVDGKANAAVVELLAEVLGTKRAHVEVVRGMTARRKTVDVHGLDGARVDALLAEASRRA
ncbi:MAG: DUF167 domain-containing protein [Acidimicrobiales bacterium]|nr:DUF167 domain-containing protein [Acidimicrobiales bacterium]